MIKGGLSRVVAQQCKLCSRQRVNGTTVSTLPTSMLVSMMTSRSYASVASATRNRKTPQTPQTPHERQVKSALESFPMTDVFNADYLDPIPYDDARDYRKRKDYDHYKEDMGIQGFVTQDGELTFRGAVQGTEKLLPKVFGGEKQPDGTVKVTNESIKREMDLWHPEVFTPKREEALKSVKLIDQKELRYEQLAHDDLPAEVWDESDEEDENVHEEDENANNKVEVKNGRPVSLAYFTGYADFYDSYYTIEQILTKMRQLDMPGRHITMRLKPSGAPFLVQTKMESLLGTRLRAIHYRKIIDILNSVIKDPRHILVMDELMPYLKPGALDENKQKAKTLDEKGRMYATGKRKEAVARVWISRGNGKMKINGEPASVYFKRDSERHAVIHPFLAVGRVGQFDVMATVKGGGTSGQSAAVRHGITRALYYLEPKVKHLLRNEKIRKKTKLSKEINLVTRDPRVVERKKPGQKKARKKFAWVKR
eukprot:CFRG5249T1